MLAEIASAAAGLKAAGELGALMLKIKVDSTVADKVKESQAAIFSAQSAMLELEAKYLELLSGTNELKQKLVEAEDWKTESEKYQLSDMGRGILAYSYKTSESTTTPEHWLCTNCYDGDHKKSILQKVHSTHKGDQYRCFRCQAELMVSAYNY